jgi:hypothetical protein
MYSKMLRFAVRQTIPEIVRNRDIDNKMRATGRLIFLPLLFLKL